MTVKEKSNDRPTKEKGKKTIKGSSKQRERKINIEVWLMWSMKAKRG